MKVFIDVGHGGADPGAVSDGLVEKEMTLMCAKGLKAFLDKEGIKTLMSRDNDKTISLSDRAQMANKWGADLFVSCHFNAGGGNRGEIIHSVSDGAGYELALKIAEEMKALGQETVRVYSKYASDGLGDYFTVIAKTNMPAVICEPCFIDSQDRVFAESEDKQWEIGAYIGKAILNWINKDKIDELTTTNDIVFELSTRDIISDKALWLKKLEEDKNAYFLAKKAVSYIRCKGV